MNVIKMIPALVAVLSCAAAPAAVNFAKPKVVPGVESLTYKADVEVRLDATQAVAVACADSSAAAWVRSHMKAWFGVEPKVVAAEADPRVTADEGYRLEAKPSGIRIAAKALRGVRYAMFSLRQIAERDSSGDTVSHFRMPEFEIADAPLLAFRGIHFIWMPEQSAELIERDIRMAAFYKFNVVVLESWGVYRSERHPWFGWKEGPMTKAAIRRLVDVANDLGIALVPQLNVFGHAAAARSCVGKHAALDVDPSRQPLFEPAGLAWNWCLSNPAAVRTVRELVVELHEAFGRPPYFHIGCDEAEKPSCASCRAVPYAQLVADHIAGVCELLRARGARAMLWHDMLLRHGDPRWKGFYANGSEETAKLAQLLPKDVIVCDWYYGNDSGGSYAAKDRTSITDAYPTLEYFAKECGFDTLTCPWEEPKGIRAQAKYAREKGLLGILETTWHHFGGERFPRMVQTSACGAWGRETGFWDGTFARIWRWCGWDMGSTSYREAGWFDNQVSRDIHER